ncbi:MAG TPA: NAD(P)H-quinone oxidoreductase, partial [Pyrinomonadaceae bacterium]|nr:NAD(P)H-quinone oxidoreductase [Pyrinomonadaceae bacterium]
MRAVIITKPGEVDVLEIREVNDLPKPTADRVLVRVHAAALNRADILQRQGKYPPPPGAPTDIPGMEFAGEVSQAGPEVTSWKMGDRVFGICGGGAQAEFVTVPSNHLARVPDNLSWTDAAAVPEVFITAHDALFTQAGLQPGETVLIHAAGSGVGTAAVQLVRSAGARSFGTSRSPEKLERAKEYGLNESMVVDGEPVQFVNALKAWTNKYGVDVILDLVGAGYFEANLLALAPTGRLILVGTISGSRSTIDFGAVMSKRLTIRGTVLRGR